MQPVNNEVANGLNDSDEFDLINSAKSVGSMGVLRPQSSFSGIKLGSVEPESSWVLTDVHDLLNSGLKLMIFYTVKFSTVDSAEAVPGKRLTFADEHGEILVVVSLSYTLNTCLLVLIKN